MKQFSLQTILLATALVAVSLAWWIDHSRPPEVVYLDLYAKDWETSAADRNPTHPDYGKPRLLATISLVSGAPFDMYFHHEYNPDIRLTGLVTVQKDRCAGTINLLLQAPDAATRIQLASPILFDREYRLDDDRFHIVVSRE